MKNGDCRLPSGEFSDAIRTKALFVSCGISFLWIAPSNQLQHGILVSVQALSWALSKKTGSPSAKLVLVAIANYADENGFCWPSQELIARHSEQSVDSVQRRLQELIKAGFLTKKVRRRQSSLYQLLMTDIKKPQDAVSSGTIDRTKNKKPQNRVKIPQLCGSEPPILSINSKIEFEKFGKVGKKKPHHGSQTKDGRRIWLDKNTDDWNQYADDYKSAHNGLEPPTQWGGDGTWFNLVGETQFR